MARMRMTHGTTPTNTLTGRPGNPCFTTLWHDVCWVLGGKATTPSNIQQESSTMLYTILPPLKGNRELVIKNLSLLIITTILMCNTGCGGNPDVSGIYVANLSIGKTTVDIRDDYTFSWEFDSGRGNPIVQTGNWQHADDGIKIGFHNTDSEKSPALYTIESNGDLIQSSGNNFRFIKQN